LRSIRKQITDRKLNAISGNLSVVMIEHWYRSEYLPKPFQIVAVNFNIDRIDKVYSNTYIQVPT
jgi:hypothetical protein